MTEVLSIHGLTKDFGRIRAVDNLDLSVNKGQVFGILGPNGSGKTTTLGMLLEIITPTAGQYSWFGGIPNKDARKQIGSILETPSFFPYLTAVQNLNIVSHIKQCKTDNINLVLKQVGLYDRRDDKFKTYSLGMKQRLSIGAALLADPPLLILDEPTNGLDPEGILEVRNLIRSISENNKTIILASHLLDEVQKVCTDFCVLKNGKKLHEGVVSEILNETNRIEIAAQDNENLLKLIEGFNGVQHVQKLDQSIMIEVKDGLSAKEVNEYCHTHGIVLSKLITQTHSLEEEFMKILENND